MNTTFLFGAIAEQHCKLKDKIVCIQNSIVAMDNTELEHMLPLLENAIAEYEIELLECEALLELVHLLKDCTLKELKEWLDNDKLRRL